MRNHACLRALLLLFASCATGPSPTPGATGIKRMVVATAEGGASESTSSEIRKDDLVKARALLAQARTELEPKHWESLDGKLTEAERAWARYESLAKEVGQVARVPRGTQGVAEAQRVAREGGEVARGTEGV